MRSTKTQPSHLATENIIELTELPAGKETCRKHSHTSADRSGLGASRGSAYSTVASRRSITRSRCRPSNDVAFIDTVPELSRTFVTAARNTSTSLPERLMTIKTLLSSRHLLNSSNASSDEIMFALSVELFGPRLAAFLASKFHWKCQRPLRALRAASSGRGKSCSARNAKRKRPSCLPVSSKKRSSGA